MRCKWLHSGVTEDGRGGDKSQGTISVAGFVVRMPNGS